LSNYITALGFGAADDSLYRKYWPGVHIIGKEILWFHAVYWPAMLMSLGEPLPKQIFAHGWWTSEGKKMSKSMGNFIDLAKIRSVMQAYSNDALRYYMVRAASFGADLDWTETDFAKSFDELGKVLGNCLNRILKMAGSYRGGKLPAAGQLEAIDQALMDKANAMAEAVRDAYRRYDLQAAAMLPIDLARQINGHIEATAPFKLAKDPEKADRLSTVLHVETQAMVKALVALIPVLPEKAVEGLRQLNVDISGKTFDELMAASLPVGHQLGEGKPLFPRVEVKAG
jgi:methionyl-tRNA synthetase